MLKLSSKPIAILSADWHGAPRAWVKRPDILGDSYYGLEQAVDLAIQYSVPLIGAGDLLDNKEPDSYTLWRFQQELERFKNAGTFGTVYFVQGQHELSDPPWMSIIGSNTIDMADKTITLGGRSFVGLDYQYPDDVRRALEQLPSGDVLITHQVFKDFTGRGSAQLDWIPNHFKLVVTGDCHRVAMLDTSDSMAFRVLSPGPLCMQSISEDPEKYVYVLCEDLSVHPVQLKSRPFKRIMLSSEEGLNQLLAGPLQSLISIPAGLPDYIAKPFLVIEYDSSIPEAYNKLRTKFEDLCHLELLALRPDFNWNLPQNVNPRSSVTSSGLSAAIVSCGCPVEHPLHGVALELWGSPNPAAMIAQKFPPLEKLCS